MKVSSILKTKGVDVVTTRPEVTIAEVVRNLKEKGVGSVVISEDGETLLGLISERDIVVGLDTHGPGLLAVPVSELMSRSVVTCTPDESIKSVMAKMTHGRMRHVPVVEGGRLRGVISIGDVVKNRLDEVEMESNVLRDAFIGRQ